MSLQKNTEPMLATHLHAKGAKLGLPISGNFELTARCNFRCPMCYVHSCQQTREGELSAGQWIALAKQAQEQGMIFALLTGGEPFMRKDFFEIYDAMREMGIMITINSNGSMLDGEIRRKLIENPPFRMNISLYGGSDETYAGMCGQPAYHRVVENVRALKEAGVDVRFNVSITPYNRQDMKKIFETARGLDLQVKAACYMYPPIRINGQQYGQGNRLSPEEAAACAVEWDLLRFRAEEFAQRAQAMKQLTLSLRECSTELCEGVSCRAGRSSFWVTWDGRMLPCGMMPQPELRPLEIGFDAAWQQLRQQTAEIRLPAQCSSCSIRQVCPVCAAVCITETGAFHEVPQYVCRMTEALIQKTWESR